MKPAYPLRIYADLACPLCRAEMRGLSARDEGQRLQVLDCSGAGFRDADSEAAGFDQQALLRRIHARDAQGRWLVGVPVFAAAYEAAGYPVVARLLRVSWLQGLWRWGYGLVADHRWLFVRLGTPRLLGWLLAPGAAASARDSAAATSSEPRP